MSLNNLKLSPRLMVSLYPKSLIQRTTPPLSQKQSAPAFLGKNQKNIMILVSDENSPFLANEDLEFLVSILTACGLSLSDIALVNLDKTSMDQLQASIKQLNPSTILLFGVAPLQIGLPINFPGFQLQQFDGRTYLHAGTLSEISASKQFKTKLWSSLKTIFKV